MRAIERTSRFKRDYRREKSGVLGKKLDALFLDVVNLLASDRLLPHRCFDHPLAGEWSGVRDCHIRPDLRHYGATATKPADYAVNSMACGAIVSR